MKMKNLFATLTMIAVLTVTTTFAEPGILVAGKTSDGKGVPCQAETTKGFTGILVAGFTGILVAGFTGILVAGVKEGGEANCGILVAG